MPRLATLCRVLPRSASPMVSLSAPSTIAWVQRYSSKPDPPPNAPAATAPSKVTTLSLDDVLPAVVPSRPTSAALPRPSKSGPGSAPELMDWQTSAFDTVRLRGPEPEPRPMGLESRDLDYRDRRARQQREQLAKQYLLSHRPGDPTSYSLLVEATPNNTKLTLCHTPVKYLPASNPGNEDYSRAFPWAGKVVARTSGGTVGFSKGQRQSYEAATQAALAMFEIIRNLRFPLPDENPRLVSESVKRGGRPRELELVFKGFGAGREAVYSALMGGQGSGVRGIVRSMRDISRLKIGGPRPKKRRIV